jgi:iron complex transport system ATP-binding protein
MKPSALQVSGLSLFERAAPLDFSLEAGSALVVIGPNGAGKSTLLQRLCAAIYRQGLPKQARVLWQGQSLTDYSATVVARHVAYLPQVHNPQLALSVGDILALGCLPHQESLRAQRLAVQSALALWRLEALTESPFYRLSGGEKQRVMLARVWVQLLPRPAQRGPRVLLLDEPFAALDLKSQQELQAQLMQWQDSGVALLATEHSLNRILRYPRFIALAQGQQFAAGEVASDLTPVCIEALFGVQVVALEQGGRRYFVI